MPRTATSTSCSPTASTTRGELDRYSASPRTWWTWCSPRAASLKAEHGTGRVMAPVRAPAVRRRAVRRDARASSGSSTRAGMLNPGVIMDDDPTAHLRHIKSARRSRPRWTAASSCGYCEPVCPSRDLTLTPRQRIVTLRAIEAARLAGDTALVDGAGEGLRLRGRCDTCAVDGMCQTACPVDINTGLAGASGCGPSRRRAVGQRAWNARRQALGRRHPGCARWR